ncbi:MAG: cytochrome c biogenesis protein ResB, partial [Candidatus Caenarcaniphilales bacterium]|nr:cytochrome c biogenesis protein ResB [Candidatus Caenarcaniphilales bacterium]
MNIQPKQNLNNFPSYPRNFKSTLQILSSAYFAAGLFILLALIIIAGTVIPQEPQVGKQALIDKYASSYEMLNFFGLTDVFHSWWYLFLMVLLAVNLTFVSFRRVFPRAKKALVWPKMIEKVNPKFQEAISFYRQLGAESFSGILEKLKKQHWLINADEANKKFVARKGAYHRLGPSITHVGILTILFGAFLSLLLGFNGVIQGVPSDRFIISAREDSKRSFILVTTSKIFHSPLWLGKSPELEVELGKTSREDHKNGSPKQWRTDLQFLDNTGKELHKQETSVNEPVSFAGIDFFQADWKRV